MAVKSDHLFPMERELIQEQSHLYNEQTEENVEESTHLIILINVLGNPSQNSQKTEEIFRPTLKF